MSDKTKINLVFPQGGSKLSSSGILPPVGIISLATYLREINPNIEVELFDGEVTGNEQIIKSLDADIVGISITGANYDCALEIAEEAKRRGAKVIVGGPQATVKHRQILANRDCIDAVVRGDGEIAFSEYVTAVSKDDVEKLSQIRNLSYRKADGSVVTNPTTKKCEQIDLNSLPSPDYSLLEDLLEQYEQKFQSHSYRDEGYTRFVSFESQKGCAKTERLTERKGRCGFCARIDKGLRRLNPDEFWKKVEDLYDPDGKTMIWDVSDSFSGSTTGDFNWLKEITATKPVHLEGKVDFKVFARADELYEESVSYLQQIGVKEVFIGIESGDQRMLDSCNKGSTVEDNLRAVEILGNYGITTYVSLIYGLRGEDSESLQRTHEHATELMERGDIIGIGARCLYPMAGSRDHQLLLREYRRNGLIELADEIRESDFIDPFELQKDWLRYMTHTNINEISEWHVRTMEVADQNSVKINDEQRLMFY